MDKYGLENDGRATRKNSEYFKENKKTKKKKKNSKFIKDNDKKKELKLNLY